MIKIRKSIYDKITIYRSHLGIILNLTSLWTMCLFCDNMKKMTSWPVSQMLVSVTEGSVVSQVGGLDSSKWEFRRKRRFERFQSSHVTKCLTPGKSLVSLILGPSSESFYLSI